MKNGKLLAVLIAFLMLGVAGACTIDPSLGGTDALSEKVTFVHDEGETTANDLAVDTIMKDQEEQKLEGKVGYEFETLNDVRYLKVTLENIDLTVNGGHALDFVHGSGTSVGVHIEIVGDNRIQLNMTPPKAGDAGDTGAVINVQSDDTVGPLLITGSGTLELVADCSVDAYCVCGISCAEDNITIGDKNARPTLRIVSDALSGGDNYGIVTDGELEIINANVYISAPSSLKGNFVGISTGEGINVLNKSTVSVDTNGSCIVMDTKGTEMMAVTGGDRIFLSSSNGNGIEFRGFGDEIGIYDDSVLVSKGIYGLRYADGTIQSEVRITLDASTASFEGKDCGMYIDRTGSAKLTVGIENSELRVSGEKNALSVMSGGSEGSIDYNGVTANIAKLQGKYGEDFTDALDLKDVFVPTNGPAGIFVGNYFDVEYKVKVTTNGNIHDTIDVQKVDKDATKIQTAEMTFDGVTYNTFRLNDQTCKAGEELDMPANQPWVAVECSAENDVAFKDVTPSSGSRVTAETVTVSGTVTGEVTKATIKVNDAEATEMKLDEGTFSENVTLAMGKNTIVLTATPTEGDDVTYTMALERVNVPTLLVVSPANGDTVSEEKVNVTGLTDATSVTVKVNGKDQGAVTAEDGAFAKTVTLAEGENTIVVTASDASGISVEKSVKVTYEPEPEPVTPTQGGSDDNIALMALFAAAVLGVLCLALRSKD